MPVLLEFMSPLNERIRGIKEDSHGVPTKMQSTFQGLEKIQSNVLLMSGHFINNAQPCSCPEAKDHENALSLLISLLSLSIIQRWSNILAATRRSCGHRVTPTLEGKTH